MSSSKGRGWMCVCVRPYRPSTVHSRFQVLMKLGPLTKEFRYAFLEVSLLAQWRSTFQTTRTPWMFNTHTHRQRRCSIGVLLPWFCCIATIALLSCAATQWIWVVLPWNLGWLPRKSCQPKLTRENVLASSTYTLPLHVHKVYQTLLVLSLQTFMHSG